MNVAPAQSPAMTDYFSNNGRVVDADSTSDERLYATFNHLAGFANLGSGGLPILGLVCAAIMWMIRGKDSPFLDDHGREATNFQISLILWTVIFTIALVFTLGLSVLGYIFVFILGLVGQLRGAMAAHRGEYYRYPCCFRFIKGPEEQRVRAA